MDKWILTIQTISPFVIAVAAYYFALKQYYKEKEYESVKQRYLNNGLDKIDAAIRAAKSQILYNRTVIKKFMYSVKMKNNLIESIDRLRESFRSSAEVSLYDIPIEKIDKLFKNKLLNARIFEAMTLAHEQCNIIEKFLINSHSETGITAMILRQHHPETADTEIIKSNVAALTDNFENDIDDNYLKFHDLEPIFSFISTAIHKLERQPFSFSQLDTFHEDKDLRSILDKAINTLEA